MPQPHQIMCSLCNGRYPKATTYFTASAQGRAITDRTHRAYTDRPVLCAVRTCFSSYQSIFDYQSILNIYPL
jgi:hypothetical protein